MTQPSDRAREAAEVLKAFDGGMVTKPDSTSPRGFTVYYLPLEAMERALAAAFERETPGFAAGVEAAAKVVLDARLDVDCEDDMVFNATCLHLAAAIRALTPSPPASVDADEALVEELRYALAAAFTQGASDVHAEWQANPGEAPGGDPDFAEAAGDYAAAALDPFSSAARGVSADFLAALSAILPEAERAKWEGEVADWMDADADTLVSGVSRRDHIIAEAIRECADAIRSGAYRQEQAK